MNKPNLFVIGAPKCGTTSLCEYLAGHPEVHFSTPKEPNYFCTDITESYCSAITEEEYLSQCFKEDCDRYTIVGDGSVSSLYSEIAVPRILKFNPNAKFIVMVRNPIDLVYSLHAHLLFTNDEDIECFQQAWGLQLERKEGRSIPPDCRMPKMLQYGSAGMLGEQLARLYDLVNKDQVLVILFDDFVKDTRGVYADVIEFLRLTEWFPQDFAIINAGKRKRSKLIDFFIRKGNAVKKGLNIHYSFGVLTLLHNVNTIQNSRSPLEEMFRKELFEYFREDIKKLSNCIGRDLSHWQ